jgi:hypothetical protein
MKAALGFSSARAVNGESWQTSSVQRRRFGMVGDVTVVAERARRLLAGAPSEAAFECDTGGDRGKARE